MIKKRLLFILIVSIVIVVVSKVGKVEGGGGSTLDSDIKRATEEFLERIERWFQNMVDLNADYILVNPFSGAAVIGKLTFSTQLQNKLLFIDKVMIPNYQSIENKWKLNKVIVDNFRINIDLSKKFLSKSIKGVPQDTIFVGSIEARGGYLKLTYKDCDLLEINSKGMVVSNLSFSPHWFFPENKNSLLQGDIVFKDGTILLLGKLYKFTQLQVKLKNELTGFSGDILDTDTVHNIIKGTVLNIAHKITKIEIEGKSEKFRFLHKPDVELVGDTEWRIVGNLTKGLLVKGKGEIKEITPPTLGSTVKDASYCIKVRKDISLEGKVVVKNKEYQVIFHEKGNNKTVLKVIPNISLKKLLETD